MNWEQFQLWHNFLLNTEYKDNLIDTAISEFLRVIIDHKNGFSNFDQNKEDLTKKEWNTYGNINSILNKIKIKFKVDLDLPRKICDKSQKFKRKVDINNGMMFNMPAKLNGINTHDDDYFYIPLHKTRRHIHGIPKDFLEQYIINMIDTAQWEKIQYKYYYSVQSLKNIDYINKCAIYECPEKFCIKNLSKKNKKEHKNIEKLINCDVKLNVFSKIKHFQIYLTEKISNKLIKYFNKKLVDNFRINFPKKSRYITYCAGPCIHSDGFIHNGIPNGKQHCYDCNITFCRECNKSPYHDNELCDFSDEIEFENPDDYRKCPGCGIWTEREEGCSHMNCKCGVHFCYDCRGILCANDPYYHICKMENSDPHYRDFRMDHPSVQYEGEIACDCRNCM